MSEVFDPVAQRDAARVRANEIRLEAAEAKREIAALDYGEGLDRVAALLLAHDPRLESIKVSLLIRSVKRMGTSRVDAIVSESGLRTGEKRVRALTDRQRVALADAVQGRAVLHWSAWSAA